MEKVSESRENDAQIYLKKKPAGITTIFRRVQNVDQQRIAASVRTPPALRQLLGAFSVKSSLRTYAGTSQLIRMNTSPAWGTLAGLYSFNKRNLDHSYQFQKNAFKRRLSPICICTCIHYQFWLYINSILLSYQHADTTSSQLLRPLLNSYDINSRTFVDHCYLGLFNSIQL